VTTSRVGASLCIVQVAHDWAPCGLESKLGLPVSQKPSSPMPSRWLASRLFTYAAISSIHACVKAYFCALSTVQSLLLACYLV
jgi:hypothetical protein